jgi:DNA topoisomerase I
LYIAEFNKIIGNYSLVICEKPTAAKMIARALGTKNFIERKPGRGIIFYDVISESNQHYVICSAFGHLYHLVSSLPDKRTYPVFELRWAPRQPKIRKRISIRNIIKSFSVIAQRASEYIHACDYDVEGELIGYNILQFACKNKYKESKRAKFSSLIDSEIRKSFDELSKPKNGFASSGKARHYLDFIIGVNFSRALSTCMEYKNYKKLYNLSMGRVQSPTLAFVVERETRIRQHIPDPYWNIVGKFEKDEMSFVALLQSKVCDQFQAIELVKKSKSKKASVDDVQQSIRPLFPPLPFNTSALQKEAYRLFKFSPNVTLSIAESLYLMGLISYPRTMSEKLPEMDYRHIISQLVNIQKYHGIGVHVLSKKTLVPSQGKLTDDSHPSIYPTGKSPKGINSIQSKVYDLITRRFIASFGEPVEIQHTKIDMTLSDVKFSVNSQELLNGGWSNLYYPYFQFPIVRLPNLQKNDMVNIVKIKYIEKYSKPPTRFNQSTLLSKMEAEGLGTKSTRADIIATLLKRKYLSQNTFNNLEPTNLGFSIVTVLKKFVPLMFSSELTRHFELQLKNIQLEKHEEKIFTNDAIKKVNNLIYKFESNKAAINYEISNLLKI